MLAWLRGEDSGSTASLDELSHTEQGPCLPKDRLLDLVSQLPPASPGELWRDGMNTTAEMMRGPEFCAANPINLTGSNARPKMSSFAEMRKRSVRPCFFAGLSTKWWSDGEFVSHIRGAYRWVAMCSKH